MNHLLLVDAIINLLLGAFLLFFPTSLVEVLGIPMSEQVFYPSILGAVLFGIGIALIVQLRSDHGLGLLGAIAINLCGGVALALWLVFGDLSLSTRGLIILWCLVAVLVGLSTVELVNHAKSRTA